MVVISCIHVKKLSVRSCDRCLLLIGRFAAYRLTWWIDTCGIDSTWWAIRLVPASLLTRNAIIPLQPYSDRKEQRPPFFLHQSSMNLHVAVIGVFFVAGGCSWHDDLCLLTYVGALIPYKKTNNREYIQQYTCRIPHFQPGFSRIIESKNRDCLVLLSRHILIWL